MDHITERLRLKCRIGRDELPPKDHMASSDNQTARKISTGVAGLDTILGGGLPPQEMYLLQGGPGTGKTTLALQFLMHGAARGEKTLFITLAQSPRSLQKIADSHGFKINDIGVHAFPVVQSVSQAAMHEQSVFHTSHIELVEAMEEIMRAVDQLRPARMVLDSIDQLRILADGPLHHQRKLLILREFLAEHDCTALLLDSGDEGSDPSLAELTHGVIRLERLAPIYGEARRRLCVLKMRGTPFDGGFHDFVVRTGGLTVFPRLDMCNNDGEPEWRVVKSGVSELDTLLGGGLEQGTTCLLAGSPGTGKTLVGTLYAHAAARRGEHAAIFLFDERVETFYRRSRHMGMDLAPLVENGSLHVQQISATEICPGEFSQMAQDAVEKHDAKVVMIDSLTGYFHAMPDEQMLLLQMHELLGYLSRREVLSLLVVAQHGLVSQERGVSGALDISYMSDTVLLLRHFESHGQVRKAISVIKKRHGAHEKSIRELVLSSRGVELGEPLVDFDGVLTCNPTFTGDRSTLAPPESNGPRPRPRRKREIS